MSLSFNLALTVGDGAGQPDDVLVRGNAEQSVAELARRLAAYLGLPAVSASSSEPVAYGLRVERTGEQLRPEAAISTVDLLEGDTVTLLTPRGTASRRRPRWAEDSTDSADVAHSAERADSAHSAERAVIPLRPRQSPASPSSEDS